MSSTPEQLYDLNRAIDDLMMTYIEELKIDIFMNKLNNYLNTRNEWIAPFILTVLFSNILICSLINYSVIYNDNLIQHKNIDTVHAPIAIPTMTRTVTPTATLIPTLRPTPLNPTWPAPSKTPEIPTEITP